MARHTSVCWPGAASFQSNDHNTQAKSEGCRSNLAARQGSLPTRTSTLVIAERPPQAAPVIRYTKPSLTRRRVTLAINDFRLFREIEVSSHSGPSDDSAARRLW